MLQFTVADLRSAHKAICSTIRKCEKAHATLAVKETTHAAQLDRLSQQLRVLYVAVTLVTSELGEQPAACYMQDELDEVQQVLPSLIHQIQKTQPKFREGTPQHTLAVRRIAAFEMVCSLASNHGN